MGSPRRTEKMNPNEPFKALAVTREDVLSSAVFSHALSKARPSIRIVFLFFPLLFILHLYRITRFEDEGAICSI